MFSFKYREGDRRTPLRSDGQKDKFCCRIDLESCGDCGHGVCWRIFAENQIGIAPQSGDNMAMRPGWGMIADLKARAEFGAARDVMFVIRM